jgi:iron(III) transport system substrate-binding protein
MNRFSRGAAGLLLSACIGLCAEISWAANLETEQTALYEAARKTPHVVVYTSMGSMDIDRMSAAFKKKYPGIETEFFRAGSGTALEKLLSEDESRNYRADLFIFHAPNAWSDLKSGGLLMKYDSPIYPEFPDYAQDPGYTVSGRTLMDMIGYNTSLISKERTAKLKTFQDWVELAELPEYRGRFGMQDTTTGAGIENIYTMIHADGEDRVKSWMKRLFAAGLRMSSGGDTQIQDLSSGQEAFNFFVPTHRLQAVLGTSAPVSYRPLANGQHYFLSPMSIYAKAPHPDAAKLFFNWWNSKEGQTLLAEVSGAYSARTDVPAPKGFPALSELNLIKLTMDDWPKMEAQTDPIRAMMDEARR